jgi:hypothetical protein
LRLKYGTSVARVADAFSVSTVACTTDRTPHAMRGVGTGISRRHAVSESTNLQKHELECLRLEVDCVQLADAVDNPSLKAHFIGMAKKWSTLAAGDSSTDTGARI